MLGSFYIKFKEKNMENIDLKNCWSGCIRCWAPKILQAILSSCLLRRTRLCKIVENGEEYVDFLQ